LKNFKFNKNKLHPYSQEERMEIKTMRGERVGAGIKRILFNVALFVPLTMMVSCGGMDPRNVDVELEESAPIVKITSYTEALSDLGTMSNVFDTGLVKIQCNDITDKTGTAATTGGEIQRNITEIMKSTLNSIGGNVVFIEYDPGFIQNQMVTGYSNFEDKLIPDVVITGGITEFDRGLETRGSGVDAAAQANFSGVPSWAPSNEIAANYGNAGKAGKARITLDFNMKDFTTLAGIAKMTTINSMEVHKATKQKEIGLTFFGPSFGLKGSIKKVQGRHEAVRLLVQISMIQMVGKYLNIPYWRLLGDDTLPDPVVVDSVTQIYYTMPPANRNYAVQQWLYIHGYDVQMNGVIDAQTQSALQKFDPGYTPGSDISEQLFTNIYLNMPYDAAAMGRRASLSNNIVQTAQEQAPAQQEQVYQTAAPAETAPAAETAAYEEQAAAPAPAPEPARNTMKSSGFGRKLTDDEW